jgi:hypothetical protein
MKSRKNEMGNEESCEAGQPILILKGAGDFCDGITADSDHG